MRMLAVPHPRTPDIANVRHNPCGVSSSRRTQAANSITPVPVLEIGLDHFGRRRKNRIESP
jgi:hypothetical protein